MRYIDISPCFCLFLFQQLNSLHDLEELQQAICQSVLNNTQTY